MYEEFLGLKGRPFLAAARVDRYYPAASIEQARQQLARCIERADGFGVVVGPSGIGKSLLCQVLTEQFRSQFKVAQLATGRLCSPRALMQAILYELNLPYRDMSEGELRLSLVDHLEPSADCPNGMLLIVDEAHSMPVRLFEEMRMLTNQVRDGMPRVRLVLAGNNRLEERLNEPRLDSFSQRVIARCYLESLNRDETMHYVRAQFAAVGGDPDQTFDESALVATHRATEGIPRLVNQLCDHALILACTAGVNSVDAQRIEEAWADLQQLPPPWSEATSTQDAAETTIEFGTLDEESTDATLPNEMDSESLPFVARFDHSRSEKADHPEEDAEIENEIQRAAQRLDQIDASIAHLNEESMAPQLESEFRPLGSFQPEVEFDMSATPDPFAEAFDDEEVVLDKYAAVSNSLAGRPQVYSTEGRAIADALAPHDVLPPSPRLATVEAHVEPVAETHFENDPKMEVEFDEINSTTTTQVEELHQEVFETPADAPLVIIEEEVVDDTPNLQQAGHPGHDPEPSVAVVEPNQFNSLFTNLRRSTAS